VSSQLATLKVLVADDHFLIRQFVRNTLQDSKITNVQTAADGNEAIDLVQKAYDAGQPYDVVFLDWNMPTISGL
jgi:CheY-like chemotaxis protein